MFVKNPILKEKMITDLRNEKIQTSFHYTPLHKFSYYKSKNLLPIVEEVSKGLVTLPLHNRLSINDVKGSALLLVKVYRNGESNNESAKYKLL
ncbi:DegT/DnrJ/EryC1/StrS family aminotransferase (plasmid) [Staphylococcus epidermidis]|nr:DegT/DnrJ/EryC1/StrS family aminotransferase [Staphylococcus epidermidis]